MLNWPRRSFCSSAFNLLATNNLVQSVEAASSSWGVYGVGNPAADTQWKKLTENILNRIDVEKEPIENINRTLRNLASSNVSIGSFWSDIFEKKIDAKVKAEKLRISDLVALISNCNAVDFRSDVVIDKLISVLLENETVWTVSPDELGVVTQAIADSFTQNRQLFTEISHRISMETVDFEIEQLIQVVESFSKVNFTNGEMLRVILKRVMDEWPKTNLADKVRLAASVSKLRFRSDTFFRELVSEILRDPTHASVDQIASVMMSMKRLKMDSGSTQWWNRENDFKSLSLLVKNDFTPETAAKMTAGGISHCVQIVKPYEDKRLCNAIFSRIKYLLTQEPLSRSHKHLAVILEGLSRGSQQVSGVNGDDLRWVAEWLCGNVYILPVHNIVTINRAIARMGFRDHNYHKIWIPYYLERLSELAKDDIGQISDNYNAIGMSDTVLGGRHFFYKLGKRFQELTIDSAGDKDLATNRKYRSMQRLG